MKFGMPNQKEHYFFEKFWNYFFNPLITILWFLLFYLCLKKEDYFRAYFYLFIAVLFTLRMFLAYFFKWPYFSIYKYPLFEIRDNNLYYRHSWGTIKKYRLSNFKGSIETRSGDQYLILPNTKDYTNKIFDFSDFGKSIYIGSLKKDERNMFLKYLREIVKSEKITNGRLRGP
jgi:hypothetical protein